MVPVTGLPANVVAYNIATTGVEGETAEGIFAAFNATKSAATINLPEGTWNICVNGDDAGLVSLGTATGTVTVNGQSSVILVKGDVAEPGPGPEPVPGPKEPINLGLILPLVAVAVVAVAVVVVVVLKKKK